MASKYSEQHYEDVAELLKSSRDPCPACIIVLATEFAALFATDNPLFNCGRFLKACGLGDA